MALKTKQGGVGAVGNWQGWGTGLGAWEDSPMKGRVIWQELLECWMCKPSYLETLHLGMSLKKKRKRQLNLPTQGGMDKVLFWSTAPNIVISDPLYSLNKNIITKRY